MYGPIGLNTACVCDNYSIHGSARGVIGECELQNNAEITLLYTVVQAQCHQYLNCRMEAALVLSPPLVREQMGLSALPKACI